MEVLAVPIPFPALVQRLMSGPFLERFTDSEAARRRMATSDFIIQCADPPAAHIVIAKATEHLMDLIDQLRCGAPMIWIAGPLEQFEKVANGECVSPKVSLLILSRRGEAGPPCKLRHQPSRFGRSL
jgi:hypothetical protein